MTRGLIRRDPGELPAEVTGFVGRQRELAVLDGLLGTASCGKLGISSRVQLATQLSPAEPSPEQPPPPPGPPGP
jgi:hypothetical protein